MRMTAVVAAIASCAIIFAHSAKADALSPMDFAFQQNSSTLLENIALETEQKEEPIAEISEEPQEVTYKVVKGDSLSTIAKAHETTWLRLFYKNIDIENPDILTVDQTLVIPAMDEELEERELPRIEPVVQTSSPEATTTRSTSQQIATSSPTARATAPRGSSAGNGYSYGYCTWYVKNRRGDLPNNLGNADTWVQRARAQGYATGSAPRVGAVAQALTGYMHVAYVEAVHGDGTITVSEMNFKGFAVQSSRVVSAASFIYIY